MNSSAIDNVDMGVSRIKMMKPQDRKIPSGANLARAEASLNAAATAAQAKAAENDSFNRHYNKELKVSEGKASFLRFRCGSFLIINQRLPYR